MCSIDAGFSLDVPINSLIFFTFSPQFATSSNIQVNQQRAADLPALASRSEEQIHVKLTDYYYDSFSFSGQTVIVQSSETRSDFDSCRGSEELQHVEKPGTDVGFVIFDHGLVDVVVFPIRNKLF